MQVDTFICAKVPCVSLRKLQVGKKTEKETYFLNSHGLGRTTEEGGGGGDRIGRNMEWVRGVAGNWRFGAGGGAERVEFCEELGIRFTGPRVSAVISVQIISSRYTESFTVAASLSASHSKLMQVVPQSFT